MPDTVAIDSQNHQCERSVSLGNSADGDVVVEALVKLDGNHEHLKADREV